MKPIRSGIRVFLRKGLNLYLVASLALVYVLPSEGIAALIPSAYPKVESGLKPERAGDLRRIQALLESRLIAQRLSDLGLTVDEIETRLAQLTDDQIHQIAQHLDELQIGGNALGIVIAILVVAILVFILLQLTGHKIIVTK